MAFEDKFSQDKSAKSWNRLSIRSNLKNEEKRGQFSKKMSKALHYYLEHDCKESKIKRVNKLE